METALAMLTHIAGRPGAITRQAGEEIINSTKEFSVSLFDSMNTAISGLGAQSAAFSNISDNLANSQTVGYKEVDTSFIDYLTESSAVQNESGSVAARPEYENEVQGTVQQSTDPIAMAVSGQGFFQVSEQSGTNATGGPEFDPQPYYTRDGDFTENSNGYLVNNAGEFLNGWQVNPTTGAVDTSKMVPIQVSQTTYSPVPTSNITLVANVPASPTASSVLSADTQVYDPAGDPHQLVTTWAQATDASGNVIPNQWTVTFTSPDNTTGNTYTNASTSAADAATFIGTADVTFNQNGTLASVVADANNPGSLSASTATASGTGTTDALVQIGANFGNGSQNISINLGALNQANGVTQYAGTNYTVTSADQDGAGPGSFTGISANNQGQIVANYNNGRTVTLAQIPLITFANADALQAQNGQAYTFTEDSGGPQVNELNSNGAGNIVVGSVEASNVDIATQLSQLIVAQQAYGANAKVITTADQMLTATLDMTQ